ncbi:hypothetical protein IMSAGC022_01456 [Alistipes sp.]|nr:hypothetical protein IMSAGC022_01456 [Alistipes sp.]
MPKMKRANLLPTSASKTRIYWQLPYISAYGNKATARVVNLSDTLNGNSFYWNNWNREYCSHSTAIAVRQEFHAVLLNICLPNLFVMILWNLYSKITNSTSG